MYVLSADGKSTPPGAGWPRGIGVAPAAVFSRNCALVAVVYWGSVHNMRVNDTRSGQVVFQKSLDVQIPAEGCWDMQFSPDSSVLLLSVHMKINTSAPSCRCVYMYDTRTWAEIARIPVGASMHASITWKPTGTSLALEICCVAKQTNQFAVGLAFHLLSRHICFIEL